MPSSLPCALKLLYHLMFVTILMGGEMEARKTDQFDDFSFCSFSGIEIELKIRERRWREIIGESLVFEVGWTLILIF